MAMAMAVSTISNIEWPDYLVIALHFALTVAVGLWVSNALDPSMGKVTRRFSSKTVSKLYTSYTTQTEFNFSLITYLMAAK